VYIVPFLFVLFPALLLIGTRTEIVVSFVTALIGSSIISAAAVGFLFRDLHLPLRALMALAGLGLLIPIQSGDLHMVGIMSNIIGGLLSILLVGLEWRASRRAKGGTPVTC
jgi:TRAP-type uncharacterized transport system fused permease subunit